MKKKKNVYFYNNFIPYLFLTYLIDIINMPKIIKIQPNISSFLISNLLYIIPYNNNNNISNPINALIIAGLGHFLSIIYEINMIKKTIPEYISR